MVAEGSPAPVVISASRRTDLPGRYPHWLAEALGAGEALVERPYGGGVRRVSLDPAGVHSLVLFSKDYSPLLRDEFGLRSALERHRQVCCHFTITGLGGTRLEPGVPPMSQALEQLAPLAAWLGDSRRLTVRFDPIVYWVEAGEVLSNLDAAETVLEASASVGVRQVRVSFAAIYRKMARRGVEWHDPPWKEKVALARGLVARAEALGLSLSACSQPQLAAAGVLQTGCIDGALLSHLHPDGLAAPRGKDRGQRADCLCTPSVDIGSYGMTCPNGCLYCYANPRLPTDPLPSP